MSKYDLMWTEVQHPELTHRTIDLLLIRVEGDPDPYTVGSVIEGLLEEDYVWVLKGGYPSGSAKTKEEAMQACESCLVEFYLDKGLMPWATAFVSSN